MRKPAREHISFNLHLLDHSKGAKIQWICFCLLFASLTLFAQSGPKISGSFSNVPLTSALNQLSEDYALIIAYDPAKLAGIQVDVSFEDQDLKGALDLLLSGAPLEYEVMNAQQAVIRPAKGAVIRPVETPLEQWIEVTVRDAETKTPLEFATVRLGNTGGYTDASGKAKFLLKGIPQGKVMISYIGYGSREIGLSDLGKAVYLQPTFSPIEDIVIEDRSQLPLTPAGGGEGVSVNPQKMQPLSFLGEADLFRTLQWAPGISGTSESAAGLEIRGGTSDQNLVLLDGIEIYNSGHFSGMFNAFNAQALNRARTLRGGFGAEYGGRISGVIDLQGVPEAPDKFHAGASVNLLNVNGYAQVPLIKNRMTLFVAGRRSYSDVFSSPFYRSISDNLFQSGATFQDTVGLGEEEEGIEVEPIATFYDVHAKLLVRPSDRDQLTATFYQGGDQIDYSFTINDSDFTSTTLNQLQPQNLGTSVNWVRNWGADVVSHVTGSYSSFKSRYENSETLLEDNNDSSFISLVQESQVTTFKTEAGVDWRISEKHQFEGGLQVNYHETPVRIVTIDEAETESDDFAFDGLLSSGYAQYQYKPSSKLSFRGGVRASYYSPEEAPFAEPRISAVYKPFEGFAAKAAFGQYYQFLNSVQAGNQLKLGETFYVLANEEEGIEVLNSRHSILGLSYQKPGFWAEAEFYHKSLDGLQTYTSRRDAAEITNTADDLLTAGSGSIMGMDLFVRKQVGKYTGWVSYTLSQADYKFDSIDDGMEFPADQDHRHELKLVNIVDLDPFQITLTWIYATGRPYTPATGIDTLVDLDGEEYTELRFLANNSRRLPAYHRMDFSFLYNFKIGKKGRASTGLTVFNVYNRENIRDRTYSIQLAGEDEDEMEILTIDRELLLISPNVFFTIEF